MILPPLSEHPEADWVEPQSWPGLLIKAWQTESGDYNVINLSASMLFCNGTDSGWKRYNKYGRTGEVETYARCGRGAASLGEANGQGRDEEAGDRELHICRG